MKILTVSASPYLLVRNGRMNSAIIQKLKSDGHDVYTAAWHHDEGFFLPEEAGTHWFEKDDKKICQVFPIEPHIHGSSGLYELMKQVQPDMIISIGDYKETDFIWEVKAMYPNLFKWLAIFCIDCLYVNENHKSFLEYTDKVISVNEFGMANLSGMANLDIDFLPYGPNHDVFFGENKVNEKVMRVICSSHNAQSNNIAAFIKSMGQINSTLSINGEEDSIIGYLHTNLYDPGEYEIELLMERYGASNVMLPDKFVSVKDSISDEEMNEEYNKSHVFVDCSVKSATGLTMLEAMAAGCIPVGINSGRTAEIISQMPEEYQFFVPHETYIGNSEEEFSVISIEGLGKTLLEIKERVFSNPDSMAIATEAAQKISKKYDEKAFTDSISDIIIDVKKSKDEIAIESF